MDIDRHDPRLLPNNCKNLNPPYFSLPTTFKKTHFNPLICYVYVKVTQLTMETFQQLFALNSDMSHYLPEASGEELHNTTQVIAF